MGEDGIQQVNHTKNEFMIGNTTLEEVLQLVEIRMFDDVQKRIR